MSLERRTVAVRRLARGRLNKDDATTKGLQKSATGRVRQRNLGAGNKQITEARLSTVQEQRLDDLWREKKFAGESMKHR